MYLFSIHSIDESFLDDSQIGIKKELTVNRKAFEEKRIKEYLGFAKELRAL